MRVKFADGEETFVMPYDGHMIDADTFEFSSPPVAQGITGMQFAKGAGKPRQIKFQNEKIYWVVDDKEFEVKTFYKSDSSEALGWARPMNSGPSYDTCFYAESMGRAGAVEQRSSRGRAQ